MLEIEDEFGQKLKSECPNGHQIKRSLKNQWKKWTWKIRATIFYFRQVREKGSPMSGPMFQAKAIEFWTKLKEDEEEEISTSLGRLECWKKDTASTNWL